MQIKIARMDHAALNKNCSVHAAAAALLVHAAVHAIKETLCAGKKTQLLSQQSPDVHNPGRLNATVDRHHLVVHCRSMQVVVYLAQGE